MNRPPRVATWFLRLVLPGGEQAEQLGDLEETFERRVRHDGPGAARRWYVRQAVTVPAWLWMEEGASIMALSAREIRQVIRGIGRAPGFAIVTVVTLALGIGANAAIFSVVDGVLLEPLPFEHPDELVSIGHSAPGLDLAGMPSSTGLHVLYEEASTSFDGMALFGWSSTNITGDGPPERLASSWATPSLFTVLGVPAAIGRTFTEEEGHPNGPQVVLLSHGLWRERFGSDPSVVGRTIQLNGVTREVVGVMPGTFAFPDPEVRLWVPLRIEPGSTEFGGFNYPGIARLKPGVTIEQARQQLEALIPRWPERFSVMTPTMMDQAQMTVDLRPYVDVVVGDVRTALWIIMGTVGFVLLIACANVANLMLVRAESRTKEVAIRTAMGASRRDLVVRFMAESVVLAAMGAVLGLVLAREALRLLVKLGPQSMPRLEQIGIDGSVLLFVGGVTVLATLAFGAIPAMRSRESGTAGVLRDGVRGTTGGRRSLRVRKLLVASQVSFALILLVGSGLMMRSFNQLRQVDPGFDAERVLTFRLALPSASYADEPQMAAFHRGLLDRLRAIPGVTVAGAVSHLPLAGMSGLDPLFVEGATLDPEALPPIIEMRVATPGYFEVMGIPLTRGRRTTDADADARSGAVLVSSQVVASVFEEREPLGRRVAFGVPSEHDEWSDVVGVVADVHNASLTSDPVGAVYFPLLRREGVDKGWLIRAMSYTLKTSVPPHSLVPAVRRAVGELDPNLPIANVRTMDEVLRAGQAQMGFTMLLLGIAAGVGLLMGSVGLYGVVSYVTAQRTREIGVRMALGAGQRAVRGMILRQGLSVATAGLVVGLVGAVALSRFMESVLFQVGATDPFTFAGVAVVLLLVSTLATWIPAARAAGTDPVEALRWE